MYNVPQDGSSEGWWVEVVGVHGCIRQFPREGDFEYQFSGLVAGCRLS